MKFDFLPDLPVPAWVGITIASVRVLLDWKAGVSIWINAQRVVMLYLVSIGVSYLSFLAMSQPGIAVTNRDTVICSVITFFGINIAYSLKSLGEDFERNPLKMVGSLIRAWRAAQVVVSMDDITKPPVPPKPRVKRKPKQP